MIAFSGFWKWYVKPSSHPGSKRQTWPYPCGFLCWDLKLVARPVLGIWCGIAPQNLNLWPHKIPSCDAYCKLSSTHCTRTVRTVESELWIASLQLLAMRAMRKTRRMRYEASKRKVGQASNSISRKESHDPTYTRSCSNWPIWPTSLWIGCQDAVPVVRWEPVLTLTSIFSWLSTIPSSGWLRLAKQMTQLARCKLAVGIPLASGQQLPLLKRKTTRKRQG